MDDRHSIIVLVGLIVICAVSIICLAVLQATGHQLPSILEFVVVQSIGFLVGIPIKLKNDGHEPPAATPGKIIQA